MATAYPEFATINTNIIGGVVPTLGRGLAIIGPHTQSGDLVPTLQVVEAKIQRTADDAFGAGSPLAEAYRSAKNSGLKRVLLMGVPALTGGPFTETFGDAASVTEFDLDADNLPVTSITSVTVDGVAKTVEYTTADPAGLTVAADTVVINRETGAGKSGTATTGTDEGIVVVYAAHDWDAAFEIIDLEPYEYLVPAGVTFSADDWGVVSKFIDHAVDEDRMWAFGSQSGAAQADLVALAALISGTEEQGKKGFVLAAEYDEASGDFTASVAAMLAKSPARGSMKFNEAPGGVTYTGTYTFAQYGGERTPASGTLHYAGINAVYKNRQGAYEVTNDRAVTTLVSDYRFHSTERVVRKARDLANSQLEALRRSDPTALDISTEGILKVKATLEAVGHSMFEDKDIDEFIVNVPDVEDVPSGDRAERFLDNVEFNIRLRGQIHAIELDLNAEL